ncbi:MAG TPA: 2-phospho-L-lactate guanylyltransferase [Solirubrobacteraceae bacterium]|jgi:2-phospho-L-lactate guanylyltransferase|nr:2-phospho-L-lactate guanylyltransferase [Solirubrobacteraceae bacterium]
MRTAAILPVKRFASAKSRLGASVEDRLRERLARAMVSDVLRALAESTTIERTIVVTCEQSLGDTAEQHGALMIEDTAELGQSAAVALGIARALADGAQRVLCVPGDCPALDPAELDALIAVSDRRASSAHVVIVPDRHGSGTNGLLLAPPEAIAPSFGADSRARHEALASDAGVSCALERPSSLLLDIDTGADLAALRERLGDAAGGAPLTRAVLAHTEPQQINTIVAAG